MNSFYSETELQEIGFRSLGKNVFISRKASFYNPGKMQIGNNVRIDDFCLLSGKIKLGSFIHVSAYSALYGKAGIELEDYTGISPHCIILSATDDFSGCFLIGPMVPVNFTNVIEKEVILKKYSQIGANCVILPGVTIEEGTVVGAMSLINKSTDCWSIYYGIPALKIKKRKKDLLKYLHNINA